MRGWTGRLDAAGFLLATAGQTAGVATLATLPPRPLLLTGALLVGVAYGPISPLIGVVVGERTPAPLRARVFGAVAADVALATPLGVFIGGALLAALPVGSALAAAAVGCRAVTLAQLRWPAVTDAPVQWHPPSTHDVLAAARVDRAPRSASSA